MTRTETKGANMSDARKLPPGSFRYGSYRDQGEETVEDARKLADAQVTELHRQSASMFFCWPNNAIDLCKQDSDLPKVVEQLATFIARWEQKGKDAALSPSPQPSRDWIEDAGHENGNYECACVECGNSFIGHKRRVLCKMCSNLLSPQPSRQNCGADGVREAIEPCKGEEKKFEEWASGDGYDMHEHPLHYLFMDRKTNAARQGWKAALRYVAAALSLTGQPVAADDEANS